MTEQLNGLLRLRASPPAVPAGFVSRPRLADRLTAASGHPVTLISAGPGCGKTLTVASWVNRGAAPGRVAWLSVNETDNDLQAFWSDVLGALAIGGAVPEGSGLLEVVPGAGFAARETRLVLAGLLELPTPVTLVLDDFHLIRDQRVLDSVGQLLEHQPPRLRLVFTTRTDPALRLHRMRVSGDVTDVRVDDLAFTPLETAELLHRNGFHLSDAQLGVLLERTEGWAAGLRLAMLCLDPADIDDGLARFTGSDRLVAEYLIEEVLNRLPAVDRQFLLTTSVAERVSAALANTLTGRADGQLVLDRLVARNALLVGLAGQAEWFRFHPMLRDLLLHRLRLEQQPEAVDDLHLRAARWFAAHGEPIPAIRHAAAAGHWDLVGRLLTEVAWPLSLTPSAPALVAALAPAAAQAGIEPTAGTLLASAVCHFRRQDFDSMVRDADDAEGLLTGFPDGDRRAAEALIGMLRIIHARVRKPIRTAPAAAELLDMLHAPPRQHLPTTQHQRLVGLSNLSIGQVWIGELDDAEATLATVQARSRELGLGLTELGARAHLAILDVIHGRLRDAHRRATAALGIATRRGWTGEPQALGIFLALAMIHTERNQPEQAAAVIDAGLASSLHGTDAACRVALGIAAIGVAVSSGDPAAAMAASARLGNVEAKFIDLPPLLARWCAVAHADARLAAANPEDAVHRLDQRPEPAGYAATLERIVLAKAHLMLDRPAAALDLLQSMPATATPYRVPLVEAAVLAAVAADRTQRSTTALTAISTAIDLARDGAIIRPFVTAGPRIPGLLTRHRHLVGLHLDFTAALAAATGSEPGQRDAVPPLLEPLSERERAVLTYLPTMLKSAEIAADLFITINTVKTHQQSIYRKLGVRTRRDAVERARALKLL